MPQVRDDLDAVQPRVLRQRRWDDLHGVRERLPAYGLGAGQFARPPTERLRDGDLRGAASGDERFLFDEAADDAKGVVQGAFGFVEDEVVGAAADDRDGLAGGFGRDAGDFDGARAGGRNFFDKAGSAQFVLAEVFDIRYWFASGALNPSALSACFRMGSPVFLLHTLQMNSTSSRSISLMHIMFTFLRKCRACTSMASRKIDFCISSTLHFAALIFLTKLRMYARSSLMILSICR